MDSKLFLKWVLSLASQYVDDVRVSWVYLQRFRGDRGLFGGQTTPSIVHGPEAEISLIGTTSGGKG